MTEHEVTEQARGILVRRLKIDPSTITTDTVIEDLGVDSLDLVTLAGEYEEAFAVTIPTKEIMKIRTFGDIVRQLSSKVEATA
jgi:acyl carrier protein